MLLYHAPISVILQLNYRWFLNTMSNLCEIVQLLYFLWHRLQYILFFFSVFCFFHSFTFPIFVSFQKQLLHLALTSVLFSVCTRSCLHPRCLMSMIGDVTKGEVMFYPNLKCLILQCHDREKKSFQINKDLWNIPFV